MIRTQVQLTEEQHAFLRRQARETGRSLSDLVREAVARFETAARAPKERALRLLGAFEADRTDVSVHHDTYLAEIGQ